MKSWIYVVIGIAIVLIIAAVFIHFAFFSNVDEPTVEEPAFFEVTHERLICTEDGLASLMNDWKTHGTMLKYTERTPSLSELTVGEKYYFVYGFRLDDLSSEMKKRTVNDVLEFSVEGLDGVYYGADAVSFVSMSFGKGVIDASFNAENGDIDIIYNGSDRVIDTYITVAFIPKRSGHLRVESLVYGDEYGNAEFTYGKTPELVLNANVTETGMLGADGEEITVSGISCGLISADKYIQGIDGQNSFGAVTEMVSDANYLVIDFNLTAQRTVNGTVCCGIYVCGDGAGDIKLDRADTAKYTMEPFDGGMLINIKHDVPMVGDKRIRVVLELENAEYSYLDMVLFVHSPDTAVCGSAYKRVNPCGQGIAKLSYTADSTMTCTVSGCADPTFKNVIIPDRYNGMPVTGINKDVFVSSWIRTLKTGKYVEKIEKESFKNCIYLNEVTLVNVSRIFERAFESCSSLQKIYFSDELDRIYANAFSDCDSLNEAHFQNKKGWTAADSAKKGSLCLGVDDASESAKYLSQTYSSFYWYRSDILNVTELKIAFSKSEWDNEDGLSFASVSPYIYGEWENGYEYNADGKCFIIIDFDVNTLIPQNPDKPTEWCIKAKTTWGSRISFIHASEETFDHIEAGGDGDCSVFFHLNGDAGQSSDIRIIYEFIPYHNGNRDTVDFNVDIMDAHGEYEMTWTLYLNF